MFSVLRLISVLFQGFLQFIRIYRCFPEPVLLFSQKRIQLSQIIQDSFNLLSGLRTAQFHIKMSYRPFRHPDLTSGLCLHIRLKVRKIPDSNRCFPMSLR